MSLLLILWGLITIGLCAAADLFYAAKAPKARHDDGAQPITPTRNGTSRSVCARFWTMIVTVRSY